MRETPDDDDDAFIEKCSSTADDSAMKSQNCAIVEIIPPSVAVKQNLDSAEHTFYMRQ